MVNNVKSILFGLLSQFRSNAIGWLQYSMNWYLEYIWIELKMGSWELSNFLLGIYPFLGSLGWFLVLGLPIILIGIWSSYFHLSKSFFSQGVMISFYGIAGLLIRFYLWSTISWNIDHGYDRFDRKEGRVCIFCWEFLGINYRIYIYAVLVKNCYATIFKSFWKHGLTLMAS